MKMLASEEIVAAALLELQAIDRGEVSISVEGPDWDGAWCGPVTFKTPSGWTFVIFNDCDEWDYLETVIAPTGERFEYLHGMPVDLGNWEPKNEDIWRNAK
jgi:hypothetical protein